MKKKIIFISALAIILVIFGIICLFRTNENDGTLKKYYEKKDGTYVCEGNIYKYKLEVSGRINNDSPYATFIYLSNIEEISFMDAWKDVFSSNTDDFINVKDAVLVEWSFES